MSSSFYYHVHCMAFIPYYGRHILACYYFFPGFDVITRIIERQNNIIDIMSQTENTPWFATFSFLFFYYFLLFPIISYYLLIHIPRRRKPAIVTHDNEASLCMLIHIMHIPSMDIWTICRKQGSVGELRHAQCCSIVMSKDWR